MRLTQSFPSMEIKSTAATIFVLFLLLSSPCASRGGADPEVYEIDYRGPQTHSSMLPPPGHSRRRPWIRQGGPFASPSQGFRDGNTRGSVRTQNQDDDLD
ncbi:hypothetical protein K2173_001910 [Erythroxylum novogranatense]|uniref:Secreted protein n=1 Tax=Erythroxylum novogranatense TaxID=1862640 RepID=A0AAV8SNY5_9ROSI|nr:hypothetical protein K2173_001910 [Erythroxylum novogranatense]